MFVANRFVTALIQWYFSYLTTFHSFSLIFIFVFLSKHLNFFSLLTTFLFFFFLLFLSFFSGTTFKRWNEYPVSHWTRCMLSSVVWVVIVFLFRLLHCRCLNCFYFSFCSCAYFMAVYSIIVIRRLSLWLV